jgi:hypothetical protein
MNTTMTMPSSVQEDTLSFLAFPAKRAAAQVNGTTEDIFQNIATILNQVVTDALSARTADQFRNTLSSSLETYMQVMAGLSKLINATVPEKVIDRLTNESLSEMESDFRNEGIEVFGEYLSNQAMFTVFSLRKITDLANQIGASDQIESHLIPADQQLHSMFVTNVLYGRFHLDCLTHSLRTSTPVFPEVLDCISDGLRPVVNAYAYIKQAADMRSGADKEEMIHIEFDEEEQELVESSMYDLQMEA